MSRLKAIKPENIVKRLKMFVYGRAGIGKTTAALQFPNSYIIDTERGCENYPNIINDANSVVFQSNDSDDIKEQIDALLTEKHPYKTLIIDPVTILYQSIQEKWTRRFEKQATDKGKNENAEMQDFGMRYWGKVKSEYKAIQRVLARLDMNVIVTAHQKDVYGGEMKKVGVTFDSMKGDDYFFDFVFRLETTGDTRLAITEKQRCEIGNAIFPPEFEWSYNNFVKYYGEIIDKAPENVEMASAKDVEKLNRLTETLRIPESDLEKWLKKADADKFDEMTKEQISKCIVFCQKKIDNLKNDNGGKK